MIVLTFMAGRKELSTSVVIFLELMIMRENSKINSTFLHNKQIK